MQEIQQFLSSIGVQNDPQLLEFIVRLQSLDKTAEFCFQELRELMEEEKAKEISEFIVKPRPNLFSKAINSAVGNATGLSLRDRDGRDRMRTREGTDRVSDRDGRDRMRDHNERDRLRDRDLRERVRARNINSSRSRDTTNRSVDLRNLISKSRPSSSRLSERAVVKQIKEYGEVKRPVPVVDLSKPQVLCKFVREGCLNLDCQFYHPPGKEPKNVLKTIPLTSNSTISNAVTAVIPATLGSGVITTGPSLSHANASVANPVIAPPSTILCKFDPHCTRYGCYFKHPSKISANKVYINPHASTSQRVFAVDQSEMMVD